jgi:hypothetical protein
VQRRGGLGISTRLHHGDQGAPLLDGDSRGVGHGSSKSINNVDIIRFLIESFGG